MKVKSLLFGEVELMETAQPRTELRAEPADGSGVASLRRSGINGNLKVVADFAFGRLSLLFGEVELMETFSV